MKHLQNLHTHSVYCDGKNTLSEMAAAAYQMGFDILGFSSHSEMSFSSFSALTKEKTPAYLAEIHALQKEYEGKMKIYAGVELEMLCEIDLSPFDYVLGACHYLKIGDEYVGFDRSQQEVARVIQTYFGGNGMAYAKKYYETLATLPQRGKIDIIAHFDLITKHADHIQFFDTESTEYRSCAIDAMRELVKKIPVLEINTGAIARGYRATPYPAPFLLKEWKRLGGRIVVSSDCHQAEKMNCAFDDAYQLARECGFKEICYWNGKGFHNELL